MRFVAICAVVAATVMCLGLDLVHADPADIPVGAQRAVFARNGTPLVAEPKTLSKAVKVLPYGRRVRVDEVKGAWLRVTEFEDNTAGATGWVRASKTVEPFAMTQGGQFRRRTVRGNGGVSAADRTAAGRQLDESSEKHHKQASSAEIRRAYDLLDKIEATKPTVEEISAFRGQGRLGRPSVARVVKQPVVVKEPVEMPEEAPAEEPTPEDK